MNLLSRIKTITGAIVLSTVASVASASTMTFADASISGAFSYSDTTIVFGFPFPGANGSIDGTLSANLYGDTSIVRDYTLTYDISASFNGVSDSIDGSFEIPVAFSINDVLALFPPIPSTSSALIPVLPLAGLLDLSGLAVTSTSLDGSFEFTFLGDDFEDFAVSLGLPAFGSAFDGTYSAEFALVADVPPVPLPASAPLLLAGLGGMMALRRKRRKMA